MSFEHLQKRLYVSTSGDLYRAPLCSVHMVNIYGEEQTHVALPLVPDSEHSFAVFCLTFSDDNSEIMGG